MGLFRADLCETSLASCKKTALSIDDSRDRTNRSMDPVVVRESLVAPRQPVTCVWPHDTKKPTSDSKGYAIRSPRHRSEIWHDFAQDLWVRPPTLSRAKASWEWDDEGSQKPVTAKHMTHIHAYRELSKPARLAGTHEGRVQIRIWLAQSRRLQREKSRD